MFAVNSNAQTQAGPDLVEVQTEGLGYQAIAGDTKLQLVSPWPLNALPKPTSTLISIASRNELLAAAGPSSLIIASTPAVREAYVKDAPVSNNVKSFSPQLSLDVPRLSQVAFTSDENYLVICAEEGGGLSVYDVQGLKNGKTQPAFQLATNGTSVRACIPNPAPENEHMVAIVLTNGQLLLANLKERQFMSGTNGAVLKEGVSCVSWSVKGKQLVGGLGNGTAIQMDPMGDTKAEIPRPPQLDGDQHVSGISWLANDLFLIIYNPTNFEMEHVPDSTYILVTRQPKTTNYTFQKMQDPVGTFGMNRCPPHHFLLRLRDFPPNLTDAILLSSTGSGEIGLITCSKIPLTGEPTFAQTANMYTTTGILDDARRAQLPVYEEMNDMSGSSDTSPIGMVLDLSSRDNVKRPMPAEEIDASSTPLPGLMVLNNEGVLSSWWFVYSESVRQKTGYPGLVAVSGLQAQPAVSQQQQSSAFGSLSHTTSGFGLGTPKPASATSVSTAPAFGAPAFGSATTPGSSMTGANSGWGSSASVGAPPQFGKPTFGTNTSLGSSSTPAFGSSPSLGTTSKPTFGTNTSLGATTSAFGAAGGLGKSQSPWGTAINQQNSTDGSVKPLPFGGAPTSTGFAAFGQSNEQAFSPFSKLSSTGSSFGSLGQQPARPSFASATTPSSNLGQPSTGGSTFGTPSAAGQTKFSWGASTNGVSGNSVARSAPGGTSAADEDMTSDDMEEDTQSTTGKTLTKHQESLGVASGGFKLTPSFKGDGSAKDDLPKPTGSSFFGSAFGNTLNDAGATPIKPIKEETKSPQSMSFPSTPKSPPKPMFSSIPSSTPTVSDKGQQPENKTPEAALLSSTTLPTKSTPATQLKPEPEPEPEPEPAPLPPSPKPQIQQEIPSLPDDAQGGLSPAGSPPVDLGDPSSSPLSSSRSFRSNDDATAEVNDEDDAPLPPDFMAKESKIPSPPMLKPSTPPKDFALPPFKRSPLASPSLPNSSIPTFTTTPIQPPKPQTPFALASAPKPPILFQPPSNLQDSPRSPSPVRNKGLAAIPRGFLSPTLNTTAKSTTPAGRPPVKLQLQSQSQQPPFQFAKPLAPSLPSQPASEPEAEIEPEADEIFDDTDDDIQVELSQPVAARKRLYPFIAHQDYVGKLGGEGIPAQAEKLFRDINSMIDTFGLNARNLSSFVKGHSELMPDGGRERADLEDEDDWCLIEIEDLAIVQKNLLEELECDRPQEVKEKMMELRNMLAHLATQRKRHNEVKKLVDINKGKNDNSHGTRPELTGEQSAILSDLRKDYANFQKLLTEAEDSISLLKARLASVQARSRGGGATTQIPTVEAIVNTIAKMTRMFEEKSGDIDLLEAQMTKLKFRTRTDREETPTTLDEALNRLSLSVRGANDKTFSTPPSSRSKKIGTFELTYSPESSDDEFSSFRNSLRSSQGASGKKQHKLPKVTNQEVKLYAKKKADRIQFMKILKEKVCERGVRTTSSGQ